MSKYINVPLVGFLKRIVVPTETIRISEDEDDKIFLTDDLGDCYEVDMNLENLLKLYSHKSLIGRGRRRLPKESPNVTLEVLNLHK